MLLRVQEFGRAHKDVFTESSPGGQAFEALTVQVAALEKQAVAQLSAARQAEGRTRLAARARVRQELETIGRCARVIARETPGFGAEFQIGRPVSNRSLLTTGRLFAEAAPRYHAQFVASGMPATFVKDLTVVLDAFEAAITSMEEARKGHAKARAAIEAALTAALIIVGKLDIFVATQFRHDVETLAEWERGRRIDVPPRVRRRKRQAQPPVARLVPVALEPANPEASGADGGAAAVKAVA